MIRRGFWAVCALSAGLTAPAGAQTLILNAPVTQVTDTTIRGGTYADTNFDGGSLETRQSDNASYVRRSFLKFDTHNTIPQGAAIASATLTVTLASASADASRTIGAYYVTNPYDEKVTTWNRRKSTINWTTAGGDWGAQYATAAVSAVAGTVVTFDVTKLVQQAVNGTFGSSRYARVGLLDTGGASSGSYREFYSSEAPDGSKRPFLTIVFGTAPAPSPTSSTSGTLLKVLHWNTHHGVGTDGKYDIDRIATWIVKINPHVVSLNEVERYTGWGNEDQPARYAALLKAKTGKTWYYHFAQRDGYVKGQGNLILSLFPLDDVGSLVLSSSRSVAQAGITVNGRRVSLFSTHMDEASSTTRTQQISQLVTWAASLPEQRIVAGDFNAQATSAELGPMRTGYYDAWAEAVKADTDVSYPDNPYGYTRNSRIDYIWHSRAASLLVLKGAQVFDTRASDGVMPSDHRPLMATYQVN